MRKILFAVAMILAPLGGAGAESATDTYTLERAVSQGLKTNFRIRAAKEEMRLRQGLYVETRALLLPQVVGTGHFTKVDEKRLPHLNGARVGVDETWSGRVEGTQSLFIGGKNIAETLRDRNLRQAAIYAMQAVVNDVVFEIHRQFYQVLLNKAQVTVREQAISLLEEELASEKKKLNAGTVSNFNVLRAEVALANAQTPYIQARDEYKLSIEEFRRILGLSPMARGEKSVPLSLEGDLRIMAVEPDLESSIAKALANRPELKQLEKEFKAGRRNVWSERSEFLPDVKGFAAYEKGTAAFSRSTWDTQEGWEAGIRGEWAVFNSLASYGRIKQAKAERSLSEIELEEARLVVEIEARRTYSSLMESIELVKASEKVVEQAEESLRLAQTRFNAGVATQLDVLDSQVALTEARTNKIQALFQFNVALARHRRAMAEFVG